jgi:hypothetical protein
MSKLIFPVEDISTGYQEGSAVTAAKKALGEQLKAKPEAYKSQWQTQLDDVMKKIMNREKFSYDFNGDALYQQYKDKFAQQGKMASADVMGQAAAMTGGYGNSYAATVGNQAYQASLQNLNDIVPELYQMALDQYNQQGQDLYNQYGIISDRENADYGKYRDTVGDWQTDRNYLASMYDSERNFDYGKHSDEVSLAYNKLIDDRNYDYQVGRDSIEDDHWDKQFKQEQDKIDLANRDIDAEVDEKYNAKVDSLNDYVSRLESELQEYRDQQPVNTPKEVATPKEWYKEKTAKSSNDPYAGLTTQADWLSYINGIKDNYGEVEAFAELTKAVNSGALPKQYQLGISNAIRSNLGRHN